MSTTPPPPPPQPPASQPPASQPPQPPASQSPGVGQQPGQPPVPPRRGLPAWGWVLIGVGALLLIGLVVIVVIAVVLFMTIRPADVDPIGAPSPEPTGEMTDEPVAPDGGPFSLDTIAPTAIGPFWGVPGDLLTEWETIVFDVDGLNHFQNAELGCDFRTYQAIGVGDPTGASDRAASEAQMDVLAEVWPSEGLTGLEREPQESVWLLMDSTDEVEFLMDRIDGTYADTGVSSQTYIIGREFLASGGALAARLECRTDVMEGPDSPLPWILDELGVSTF